MPIAENFPEGLEPTGKISLDDGNFHIMWGPGKKTNTDGSQAEVFADADVVAAYTARGEEQVPLGVSGTMVAVDWDSCCLLYTSPSPRDQRGSRMPSSA